MERVIPIRIRDKIAAAPRDAVYVCGNSDYTIKFDFDDEWEGLNPKTARFVYNGQFTEMIFSGDVCPVPIISNTYAFEVGVYAGNLSTTTKAYVPATKSVLCGSDVPAEPVSVYVPASELEKKVDKEYFQAYLNDAAPKDISQKLSQLAEQIPDELPTENAVLYWLGLKIIETFPSGKYIGFNGVFQADMTYDDEYLGVSVLRMTYYYAEVYIEYSVSGGFAYASGFVRVINGGVETCENFRGDSKRIILEPYVLGGLHYPCADDHAANKKYVDDAIAAALDGIALAEEGVY